MTKEGIKQTLVVAIKVALDILIFIIAFSPVIILGASVQPFKRGFFCDDEDIKHPYKPFEEDIVPPTMLAALAFGLPLIIIIVNELAIYIIIKIKGEELDDEESSPLSTAIASTYKYISAFLFGAACTMTTTFIIKYIVGRLRPYFFTICQPDFKNFTCVDSQNLPVYIIDDVCTASAADLKEARQSHPSGHSSSAMYAAVYITLYLFMRFNVRFCQSLRPLIQLIILNLGLACCVSRVSDYKHHPSDVLAGGLLGTVIALITGYYISDIIGMPSFGAMWRRICGLGNQSYPFEALPTTDPDTKLELPGQYKVLDLESAGTE